MKKPLLALFLIFLPFLVGCSNSSLRSINECDASRPSIVITGVNLIDGYGGDPAANVTVQVQGERICAIENGKSTHFHQGSIVLMMDDAYILPGIINAHVHGAYFRERLASWAQDGVTTVRDMGSAYPDGFEYIDNIDPSDPRYARRVDSGAMLTAPGGYPIAIFAGTAREITTVEDARVAVNEFHSHGAEFIKIAVESGDSFFRTIPMLTQAEVEAIVSEAHLQSLVVSAHVTSANDMQMAARAGVDDIAHMPNDKVRDFSPVIDNDVYIVPTLELWQGVDPWSLRQAQDNLTAFTQAGGKVALGTDYLGYWTIFQMGMPLIEMELMQEAGMTPVQIITAATLNAAHVCGLDELIGSIEVGKIADLLIVQRNPYEDIHALEEPLVVIHNGAIIRDDR